MVVNPRFVGLHLPDASLVWHVRQDQE